ncbi:hypothetical protein [Bacillus tuaregi]|uniref:hypothetical protein n=1 Tax=Bacillus tuaregi TaxID=1816695 RepID=UPI0008F9042C|nr:hypothetical protein [Bacillus tuaregi]
MFRFILILSIILFFQQEITAEGRMDQSLYAASKDKSVNTTNFSDIVVKKENDKYIITGKSKVKKGVFYYSVEDGHRILIPETKVRVNNLYWTSFKLTFSIPVKAMPENGVLVLNLYEKNRSKEIRDPFPVFLDRFSEQNKQS